MDDLHITRPLMKLDELTIGSYAVSGESVLQFPSVQEKEWVYEYLEEVREQNPGDQVLLVLDNFSSRVCGYTCKQAYQLEIDLVFLLVGPPDLNPTEQVWKSLKWGASPPIVESAAEYRTLFTRLLEQPTTELSFTVS